jgi:hypothetical protein
MVILFDAASALPGAWSSRLLGEIGTASVKLLRMDGTPAAGAAHAVGSGSHGTLLIVEVPEGD